MRPVSVAAGGETLAATLYRPPGGGPGPAVVMAHGYGALKESLEPQARLFAAAGLTCLVFDHPHLGGSTGQPRQRIDPWQQVRAFRHAITCARCLPEVEPDRIGLWGTSFSGAHVLVAAALDPRVRAVVAQTPMIDPWERARRGLLGDLPALYERIAADRADQAGGADPATIKILTTDPDKPAVFHWAPEDVPTFDVPTAPGWRNEVTLDSIDLLLEYTPEAFAERISVPTCFILAAQDRTNPVDLAQAFAARVSEPSTVVLLDGGHEDPYGPQLKPATEAAIDWFGRYL